MAPAGGIRASPGNCSSSVCIFGIYCSMVKGHCLNFRIITTVFSGAKFMFFTLNRRTDDSNMHSKYVFMSCHKVTVTNHSFIYTVHILQNFMVRLHNQTLIKVHALPGCIIRSSKVKCMHYP